MPNEPLLCKFVDEVYDIPADYTDFRYFLTEKLRLFSGKDFGGKKVLMLTRKHDREADLVGIGLLSRGIDYARLNIDDIPDQVQIRYVVDGDSDLKVEFRIRQEELKVSDISVVWLREFDTNAINLCYASSTGSELSNIFSFQQWDAACRTLESSLKCEWISNRNATIRARPVVTSVVGMLNPTPLATY